MRGTKSWAGLVVTAFALASCASTNQDALAESAGSVVAPLRTVGVHASHYYDPESAHSIQQWGSHVVLATLVEEYEIAQVIYPAEGGSEKPMDGPSLRGMSLRIDELLWSHSNAVLYPQVGELINTTSGDGFDIVDGEKVAVVVDGHLRMNVKGQYLLTLVDDVRGGRQLLQYMDGSARIPDERMRMALIDELSSIEPSSVDARNVPRKGVPFSDRLREFAMGTKG